MSQSTLSESHSLPVEPRPGDVAASIAGNEFEYRPIPPLAPVTVFLGVCSAAALLSELVLPICILGIVVGLICLRQIRAADGNLGGKMLVRVGLALSVLFFFVGTAAFAWAYSTEVPEGFQRVHFFNDISRKEFIFDERNGRQLHPDVEPLIGQKIFIKGYIWTTRANDDMTSFILLKDNGKCCFGGDPAAYDHMLILMQNGKTADYKAGRVYVAGVLRWNENAGPNEPVYFIEATHYGYARTAY